VGTFPVDRDSSESDSSWAAGLAQRTVLRNFFPGLQFGWGRGLFPEFKFVGCPWRQSPIEHHLHTKGGSSDATSQVFPISGSRRKEEKTQFCWRQLRDIRVRGNSRRVTRHLFRLRPVSSAIQVEPIFTDSVFFGETRLTTSQKLLR